LRHGINITTNQRLSPTFRGNGNTIIVGDSQTSLLPIFSEGGGTSVHRLVSEPLFIAQEIYFLSGAPLVHYYYFPRHIFYVIFIPCLESLLILAIVSTERYIAMKYSLKYANIVRHNIPATSSTYLGRIVYVVVSIAIFIIVCCHTTVYFVSRQHMNHNSISFQRNDIKFPIFLEERKALKTTSLILVSLFLSYVQGILDGLFRFVGVLPKSFSEAQIRLLAIAFLCIFLSSLFNPLIFCWRNKDLRKVMLERIKIRQNENAR